MEITTLEKTNAELEALAICDSLTGLYTRRFMNDRLVAMQSEAMRFNYPDVFVLFVDIDHFKLVNDKHGHDAGDQVLVMVAETVRAKLRASDVAGRWGGEEIVVLGRGNGEIVAERIRRKTEETYVGVIQVTVSIGLAMLDQNSNEPLSALIKRADDAMYEAKNSGRNQTCIAHPPFVDK